MAHALDLLILVSIFGCVATIVSYLCIEAGILHVAAAAFLGIGAYTYAIARGAATSPLLATAIAAVIGAVLGLGLAVLTLRLKGSQLALATMGVGIVVYGFLLNATALTSGPMGRVIPAGPSRSATAVFGVALLIVLIALVLLLERRAWGARVRALRDDEELSEDLGLQPRRLRLILFALTSSFLAVAGVVYAEVLRFIDPSSFTVAESVVVLAMALIIPIRTAFRGVGGAALYVAIPEILRFFGGGFRFEAELREVVFATLLIVVVARGGFLPAPKKVAA